ncbi:hypothetical protein BO82DRAFT_360506 [Aspergillus uvarum CBS 121591]|uniref:Rhodopsin domain-containing protein n=1 Tax=Aspergillus uvarum CBS 121591 TaxID=1448315 RepID=A0A319D769_9EURO|nr:hypothetical protein BO82DRAFT_360506 [Aspergillus uvarum CBS 121591]PYH86773.1 hypothetical protein BO82DRAFT_360506 [Aspergillus uvarum CBS 121591]
MALTLTGVYNARQLRIVVINSILVFLSVTAVLLRFWARNLQALEPFLEDYLIVVALVLSLGVKTLLFQSLHAGVGEHVDSLTTATVQEYALNLYLMQLLWNTCLPIIKLSIALFYQHIFPIRSMVIACRSIIVFLFAWYLAFQTTAIFQCTPIHHAWQKRTTNGRCIKFVPFVVTLAATNLCTDILLLALPTREIWKLQIAQGKKIGLSVIFYSGCYVCCPSLNEVTVFLHYVCIISVVRLENLIAISNADITWSDTCSHLWTAIESSLGVVVACLPSLMPIVRLIRHGKEWSGQHRKSLPGAGRGSSSYLNNLHGSYELSQPSIPNHISSGPVRPRLRAGSSNSALIEKYVGEIEVTTEIAQQVESSTGHT